MVITSILLVTDEGQPLLSATSTAVELPQTKQRYLSTITEPTRLTLKVSDKGLTINTKTPSSPHDYNSMIASKLSPIRCSLNQVYQYFTIRWPSSVGAKSRKEEKSQVLAFDYVYGHSNEALGFQGF